MSDVIQLQRSVCVIVCAQALGKAMDDVKKYCIHQELPRAFQEAAYEIESKSRVTSRDGSP